MTDSFSTSFTSFCVTIASLLWGVKEETWCWNSSVLIFDMCRCVEYHKQGGTPAASLVSVFAV